MGPIIFAFGPGDRYVVSNGTKWWWNELPSQLHDAIGSNARNVDAFIACAFGANDQHFITFRQRGGKITQRRYQLPAKLNDWLYKNSRYTRNLETLRVVLGPNDSFFAMDKNGVRWGNLPGKLETYLQESLTLEGWKAPPRTVAIGIDGAFVLVDWKGNIRSDLQGRYDDLDRYLSTPGVGQDIEFISLDAFRGRYYFLKKKGGRRYWTPPIVEKTMPEFIRQLSDSAAIPPRSLESVMSDKKAIEGELVALKVTHDALEAKHRDTEARARANRKDLIERKREWKERLEALTKELSAVRTATTNAAAKAIAMTNERVSHDSTLRQQLQSALQTNESHNKAMMELNTQFVEVMNSVSVGKQNA